MRLFSVLFFGIFLLASGVLILLTLLLRLNVNVGRLLFGLFILLVGISLLTGSLGWEKFQIDQGNTVAFSSWEKVEVSTGGEYFVMFGSADYDLTKLEPGAKVRINSLFGSCTVRLPSARTTVRASSAFGSISLPDDSFSFDTKEKEYGSGDGNIITVEVSAAFGSASVIR